MRIAKLTPQLPTTEEEKAISLKIKGDLPSNFKVAMRWKCSQFSSFKGETIEGKEMLLKINAIHILVEW